MTFGCGAFGHRFLKAYDISLEMSLERCRMAAAISLYLLE